jgi:hypothetical protein
MLIAVANRENVHGEYYQNQNYRKYSPEHFANKYSSGKEKYFTVGTVRNTNLHSVGGMQSFSMLKRWYALQPLSFERKIKDNSIFVSYGDF